MHKNRFYVPNFVELRKLVMDEMHKVPYAGHPRYQRTIVAMRSQYIWPWMNKGIAEYIAKCMECKRVNMDHRNPTGMLQQ